MPASIQHEENRHQGPLHSNRTLVVGQSPARRKLPAVSWAETTTSQPHNTDMVQYKTPTFHTIAKDGMIPFPFEVNPHLQVTCRYSKSKLPLNESIFRHIFLPRQYATREVLQLCKTAAAKAVKGRLGVVPQRDHLGDPIIVVTKKVGAPHGTWTLTRDIRVRFPSARSVKQA